MPRLFRDEVVAERAASLFGGVAVPHNHASSVLSLLALLAVVALVAALSVGTYARKEHAVGRLVPAAGVAQVATPRAGVLEAVLVAEGERVERGAALFTITAAGATTAGVNAHAAALAGLIAERDALLAQRATLVALARQTRADAERRVVETATLAASLAQQLDAARERAALFERDLARLAAVVDDGLAAASLLDLRRAEMLGARAAVHALERERAALAAAAAEAEATALRAPLEHDADLAEFHARLLALERGIASADQQWSSTARAPAAGRVVLADIAVGQSVAPGQTLLAIVPADGALHAELLVPARAVGLIGPGQRVRLRYDAFPYRKYGTYDGRIRQVSAAPVTADGTQGPAYRVLAAIDRQAIMTADGARIPLRAGFTLQADIVRDRQRLIEWLFEPLLDAVAAL